MEKGKKKHVVPLETVFRPDPNGDKEDTREVERRKSKPLISLPWKVYENEP